MSRFFKGASDSESDSEDDYSSDEEEVVQKAAPTRVSRVDDYSDDEDEVVKRVVKSAKDKREEEFTSIVSSIREHVTSNEWASLTADFEKLNKAIAKASAVVAKEGVPRAYVKGLVMIEDAANKMNEDKEKKKKMNSNNAKAMNSLLAKLKKNNKTYEAQMKDYRANPDAVVEDKKPAAGPSKKAGAAGAKAGAGKKPAAAGGDDDDEDDDADDESDEFDDDDDEDDDSDDDRPAAGGKGKPSPAPARSGISKWLKKPGQKDSESESDSDVSFDDLDASDDDESDGDEDAAGGEDKGDKANKWMTAGKKPATPTLGKKPAAGDKPQQPEKPTGKQAAKQQAAVAAAAAPVIIERKEMTPEQVDKRLAELLSNRGKRGTDRLAQIEQLDTLASYAKSDTQLINILMHLVSAHFDANPSMASYMPVQLWRNSYKYLARIMSILAKNSSLVLVEDQADPEQVLSASTSSLNASSDSVSGETSVVSGGSSLVAYIERLDDEFVKSLQVIDPHTSEYVTRLQDEQSFLDIAETVQAHYEQRVQNLQRASRVAARRLEHLYYKTNRDMLALARYALITQAKEAKDVKDAAAAASSSSSTGVVATITTTPSTPTLSASSGAELANSLSNVVVDQKLIYRLATMIYAHGDDRLKARAMMCHIYYLAIHEKFYEARDLMLMSRLQESIQFTDIPTQILYNRTMAQLGLCAFRSGLIPEAHSCLSELFAQNKIKELLAQGLGAVRYNQERNPEQEKIEKKRQAPYHMHINLELLECVHLISAMLLEVPNMAANAFDPKKRVISKKFRSIMDYFDRLPFIGPPESTRDHVHAAAKALFAGDWKTAERLLVGLKAWNLLPNPDAVRDMIRRKLQEEGLRTFLFSFGRYYDSLSLEELTRMFDLPQTVVHSIISKMIINEELHATWDNPTASLVMHKAEATRLQYLALAFAEKAAQFVENNEKLLEGPGAMMTGGRDNRGDRQGYGYGYGYNKSGGNQGMGWVQQYGGGSGGGSGGGGRGGHQGGRGGDSSGGKKFQQSGGGAGGRQQRTGGGGGGAGGRSQQHQQQQDGEGEFVQQKKGRREQNR